MCCRPTYLLADWNRYATSFSPSSNHRPSRNTTALTERLFRYRCTETGDGTGHVISETCLPTHRHAHRKRFDCIVHATLCRIFFQMWRRYAHQMTKICPFKLCFYFARPLWIRGMIYKKCLTTILRLSYDNAKVRTDLRRRPIYRTSYKGCKAFLGYNSLAKSK